MNLKRGINRILFICLACCLLMASALAVYKFTYVRHTLIFTKSLIQQNIIKESSAIRFNHPAASASPQEVVLTPTAMGPLLKNTTNPRYLTEPETPTLVYPLKLSANGRYLEDQNNQPVFWSGDAGWSLIIQGTNADIDDYLSNRQQKGVNVILVNLIDHQFGTNAPSNIYGDPPFTGNPFTTPNEAYFAHADYMVSSAAQNGMAVLLDPLYLGSSCGPEGWCAEVQAASISDMQSWGEYVGNRYTNFDNIIWVIGGDVDPTIYNLQDKVTAFVTGLQLADTRHLITAHNVRGEMAVTPWPEASWLTVNDTYTTYVAIYQLGQTAYEFSPVKPFFQIEGYYENEHDMTNQQLRAQAYWTILSGGMGYIFGNCPVWGLGSPASGFCPDANPDWRTELDYPGAVDMMFVQELFSSRSWQNLVPDFSHKIVIAGYGTFGGTDYVTAGETADGSLALAYLPTIRAVTVDLTKMSSMIYACWYDPTNGIYTNIEGSPFSNTGTYQFTPPGNNTGGDGDWILVLEATPIPTLTPTATPNTTLTPAATPTTTCAGDKIYLPIIQVSPYH